MTGTRPHIIIMIGDDGCAVVPHNVPAPAPFFASVNGVGNGMQEITSFIARHPAAQLTLLVDNLAQDYRADNMPRLNPVDRAQLLRRRLRQHFPAARLTASLRHKTANDQFLLAGLHEGNPVFLWAEKLHARFPSIALLPVEGARLAASLMPEATAGWVMTVSRHQTGGYRQIVTHKGDLIFTRLTPLPAPHDDAAVIITRDIKASLDYLSRHGLRHATDLSVLLLMTGIDHLHQDFMDLGLKSIASLSPFKAAQRLALPFAPAPEDDCGDLLFAAALAARKPVLPLMLPHTKQALRTETIKKWGLRVAIIFLFLATIQTVWAANSIVSDIAAGRRQEHMLAKNQADLARMQASAAPLTAPLGQLRQAIERRRIYDQPTPMPWHGLDELAQGLGSDISVMGIEWDAGDDKPESFTVDLAVPAAPQDRAQSVADFTAATQKIAHAMPDYEATVARTPYPDLPQQAVTTTRDAPHQDPTGEMILKAKTP
ncbi:MAG: hypothetical protein KGI37_04545 [Alphaproteobacteria bacterium]|nr:hypothetical protein [Alphaproteobacteria bacterium]